MPKVIQFTNQMFDYGVERFFPEKVRVVRASTLDSRFMTSHGKFCIVADDSDFITHVGIEVGKAAMFYVEKKLGWDFTYYTDPSLKKPENEDDEKKEGDDGDSKGSEKTEPTGDPEGAEGESEGETQEGGDGQGIETDGEVDDTGSSETPEGGGSEGGETPGEDPEEVGEPLTADDTSPHTVTRTVTPPMPAENIDMQIKITEDEVTVENVPADDDDEDDLPFADDESEPKPVAKPKAKPKGKKKGKGKKK